ncbi:hypothetical protein [Dietzia maris]|uniref:hypothetical protein n=1 Tax=Dietzia maris TaxID=37915 RepID=UPI0037CBD6CF
MIGSGYGGSVAALRLARAQPSRASLPISKRWRDHFEYLLPTMDPAQMYGTYLLRAIAALGDC